MAIEVVGDISCPTSEEFSEIAYRVIGKAFEVHNSLGRFVNERIFKNCIVQKLSRVELEVPIRVRHAAFCKTYFLDMLVDNRAVFEWKAVEALSPKHRSQLLNYLMLCSLYQSKLINIAKASVEHEFVNTTLTISDRREFEIDTTLFQPLDENDRTWLSAIIAAVKDWGTGLDGRLYDEFATFAGGGANHVFRSIDVRSEGKSLGFQHVRMIPSGAIFRITTSDELESRFTPSAQKFLAHTELPAFHWINEARRELRVETIRRPLS